MSEPGLSTAISPETTLAEAVVEILQAEGVSFLSAYPTTPVINAAASRGLRPVLCRQERVGAGIADGYSRVTKGRPPGVFAMQWGPGVENAYAGIATAFADSVPMMFLPLGYQDNKQDDPRFHNLERLRPVAKSVERIRAPHRTADVMRRAFSQMNTGRPGPVVVEVPIDLATKPVGARFAQYRPTTICRSAGDPDAVEAAARVLASAERPVILAGQGVLYAEASAELVALAELLDAPTGTTLEGKGAFPEDHALALGAGGMTMPEPLRGVLDEADVLVAIGTSLTRHMMVVQPPASIRTIVHITVDPYDINKDYRADAPIVGDAKLVLAQLLPLLRERLGGHPAQRGSAAEVELRRAKWMQQWQPLLESTETPINPYRVVGALRNVLDPARSIVTHDSGSPRDQILPFYQAVPHGYLGWGKSHALGTGLGLIMGAKLAEPDKFCINLMGDAAFGMVGLDFETAVRNEIPITTVVLNNGTMAVETEALSIAQERYGSRDIGGKYADLALAMGGWARRIDDPSQLEVGLKEAMRVNAEGKTALLEVITTPQMTPFSARLGSH